MIYTAQSGLEVVSTHVVASVYFLERVFRGVPRAGGGYGPPCRPCAALVATEGLLVSEQQSRALIDHAAEAITVLDLR